MVKVRETLGDDLTLTEIRYRVCRSRIEGVFDTSNAPYDQRATSIHKWACNGHLVGMNSCHFWSFMPISR